jgi:hypothetical protein
MSVDKEMSHILDDIEEELEVLAAVVEDASNNDMDDDYDLEGAEEEEFEVAQLRRRQFRRILRRQKKILRTVRRIANQLGVS